MATVWSAEQVLALAPDAGSAKSGKELSASKKWKSLGAGEEVLWGECQGSGASPYQTKISLPEPAFHCSCPSRKFPCKHAIGLFLLWTSQGDSFTRGEPPAWVVSWLEGRSKRADQKAQKEKERQEKLEKGEPVVDLAAQKKREQARWSKVNAGLDDLGLWIGDLMRHGLATLQSKPGDHWEEQARRMVDAQAPGLARRLRQLSALPLSGEGWQGAVLERLARLHLVIEGKQRLETLPENVLAELRTIIGLPVDQNEVRGTQGLRDVWQIIGQRVEVEDRLRTQRTWLLGRDTGQSALILDFAYGTTQALDTSLTPGFQIDAELAFFPGAFPLRALVKERHAPAETFAAPFGHTSITSAYAAFADVLARTPWLELYPLSLSGITLQRRGKTWLVRDAEGMTLPLSPQFGGGWQLLGVNGGQSFTLAGEFDGELLNPLAFWFDGRFHRIAHDDSEPVTRGAIALDAPEDLAQFWRELSASALVGLERRPAPSPPPTSALAGLAASFSEAQAPARLLGLAAAATLYGQVGRKPALDTSPPIEPSKPDDLPECEAKPAQRLQQILHGDFHGFLPEWLDLLSASGRRLGSATLAELLTKARQDVSLRAPLSRVLGNRGRWLASLNSDWGFVEGTADQDDPDAIWQTGSRPERRQALKSVRSTDPARGLALVTSTWSTETADDRTAFVEALEIGLSMADEEFLEAALDDKSKQVRRASIELLLRLPESRLCTRMVERARPLLAFSEPAPKKGKSASTARDIAVSPPSVCDKSMVRDGIEAKPPSGQGERGWWLEQIVAATPPSTWCQTSEDTPERLVRGLLEHKSEWNELLWMAWAKATIRASEPNWAMAFLANLSNIPYDVMAHPILVGLMKILPKQERDAFLRDRLRSDSGELGSKHPAFGLLQKVEGQLGIELAREVLQRVRRTIDAELEEFPSESQDGMQGSGRAAYASRRPDYQAFPFIAGLARLLPPELIEEAEYGFPETTPPGAYFCTAYRQFLDALRFRHKMHEEFAR